MIFGKMRTERDILDASGAKIVQLSRFWEICTIFLREQRAKLPAAVFLIGVNHIGCYEI